MPSRTTHCTRSTIKNSMDEKRYDRRMNGKRVKQGVGFKGGIWLRFKSLRRQFQSKSSLNSSPEAVENRGRNNLSLQKPQTSFQISGSEGKGLQYLCLAQRHSDVANKMWQKH